MTTRLTILIIVLIVGYLIGVKFPQLGARFILT